MQIRSANSLRADRSRRPAPARRRGRPRGGRRRARVRARAADGPGRRRHRQAGGPRLRRTRQPAPPVAFRRGGRGCVDAQGRRCRGAIARGERRRADRAVRGRHRGRERRDAACRRRPGAGRHRQCRDPPFVERCLLRQGHSFLIRRGDGIGRKLGVALAGPDGMPPLPDRRGKRSGGGGHLRYGRHRRTRGRACRFASGGGGAQVAERQSRRDAADMDRGGRLAFFAAGVEAAAGKAVLPLLRRRRRILRPGVGAARISDGSDRPVRPGDDPGRDGERVDPAGMRCPSRASRMPNSRRQRLLGPGANAMRRDDRGVRGRPGARARRGRGRGSDPGLPDLRDREAGETGSEEELD